MSDLAECLPQIGHRSEVLGLARQAAEVAARTIPISGYPIRNRCDKVLADLKHPASDLPN